MIKTRVSKFVMLLLFSMSFSLIAQNKKNHNKIMVLGRPNTTNKILLRWAPTTPIAFRKLSKYGYELKRYTISINGKTLSKPIEERLGVFKPAEPEEWMKVIDKNNNAAVMAQSLFGDSFNVEGVGTLQGIINMSQEQEQRFTWALYVADQDFEVAKMAGMGFEDVNIKPNEKYVYKVFSLVPASEMVIEDGGVFIGMQDYQKLPKPVDLTGEFLEGKVMLSWNYAMYEKEYNSYFIERSEDGIFFKQINELPYTTLNSGGRVNAKRIYYIDSIANNKKYFYRVKGRTPFGELSPPSDVISGKANKILEYVPKISYKEIVNNNKGVVLKWDFMKEGESLLRGFELNQSNKVDGVYKTVIKDISPAKRKIQYDNIEPTNYFTITAIGKEGNSRTSYPVLVQPVDSIPPVKPVGLEGKVDSLGVVTLKWIANKESDMLGYRVFKGNNKNEEYSQITVAPHKANVYYDSISVKSLNDKVFYKIVAVDQRFNMSEYSETLILKKPDFIPPSSPVITYYKAKDGVVNLKWANSQSRDLVSHNVYRRVKDSIQWNLIKVIPKDSLNIETTEWKDESIIGGQNYQYLVRAEDDSKLLSENTSPTTVEVPRSELPSVVKNIGSYVDKKNGFIELFWKKYDEPNIAEIMIYKGVNDEKMALLRNVPPTVKRYVDEKVNPNNVYKYLFRPVFKDGSIGNFLIIEIKY